jgi:hypothetical protein
MIYPVPDQQENLVNRVLVALALTLIAFTHAALAAEPESRIVAFVGKLVSIKELPDPCGESKAEKSSQDPESICIAFDALFEARYEVIEVLSGELPSKDVTFNIADHYGFPRFADYRHALLFVDIGSTENWLAKYQGYAVHPASAGSWASCGNPYDERSGDAPRGLRPVSFARDFGTIGEFTSEGVARRLFDSKEMVVEGDRITCRNGVYAAELYDRVRAGVMSARGIKLPRLDTRQDDP